MKEKQTFSFFRKQKDLVTLLLIMAIIALFHLATYL
jgi:hypothetical protein